MMINVVKHTFYGQFFWTLNFGGSPFPGQLRQEKVLYPKRKPYNVLFESNTKTGRFSVMRNSRRVLVKVVLFQLKRPGHHQNDTTPIFFLILIALCQGFQMIYYLFLNSISKMVKTIKVFSRKVAVPRYMSTSLYTSNDYTVHCAF